ncbi:MAG TPA: phenylalanine--tRNA ligase subunit beta [Longimicrobiales bacterium]|nr:phenylalanine--tRNA ligase subunit beta [Longimicrobiales bacterium]
MNISYRWLKELAPTINETPQEIADRLAMLGAPVDEVIDIGASIGDVVIARTVSVERHPNADRLSLCQVDAGGEILQVVCGAPNVRANAYYPFAPVGSSLPGGVQIKKAKIRGSESQGMLCSARELNLGRDHDGILELHGDFTLGQQFIEAVGLNDARIVVDVTPNRGDLLSHWGVAREVAPGGQSDLRLKFGAELPAPEQTTGTGKAARISIRIDDPDLCRRYIGVAIEGVKIGPSPEWLASRLRAIGSRPINNVVDATNFVLHELGQPLHAFDLDRIGKNEIIIRRAQVDEQITTLDGENRKLTAGMLVIADGDRASAIAGVMGGRDSEVTEATTNILLECALFEPKQIRKTRTAIGLSTDASYRFERGVDPDTMSVAVQRVIGLIIETAGGKVTGATDVYPNPMERTAVRVRPERVSKLLGKQFSATEIGSLLEPIGFAGKLDGKELVVDVPGHRVYDVAKEVDVIEEIARRYGYNNFDTALLPFRPSGVPDDVLSKLETSLRDMMVARGFMEARTTPFAPAEDGDVELMHPLSSAESKLRRSLLPGLLKRVEYNLYRGVRNVRLFEIGTAFAPGSDRPSETTRIAAVFTGLRTPPHWTGDSGNQDVWDLKGLVEDIAAALGIGTVQVEILGAGLGKDYIDAPAWAGEIFGFEALLPATGFAAERITYQAVPQFPAIEQDIALIVPEALSSELVERTIRQAAGIYLESVHAFDLYRGAGIPAGTRSIAYRLRFRASDRTLTDKDADEAVGKVLNRLNDEHGVERRG